MKVVNRSECSDNPINLFSHLWVDQIPILLGISCHVSTLPFLSYGPTSCDPVRRGRERHGESGAGEKGGERGPTLEMMFEHLVDWYDPRSDELVLALSAFLVAS